MKSGTHRLRGASAPFLIAGTLKPKRIPDIMRLPGRKRNIDSFDDLTKKIRREGRSSL